MRIPVPQSLVLIVLLGAFLQPSASPAQAERGHVHADSVHREHTTPPDEIPPELLTRPLPLRQGIGRVHEPVGTSSPEAQAYYDQGLAYLHSYVPIEAARSFHQSLRLDPGLAMAELGLVRVHLPFGNVDAARAALERAKSGARDERTKRRVAIVERQFESIAAPGDAARLIAYRQAIDDALAQELDNPELWLLRGNADEALTGAAGIGQYGGASTIAYYQQALRLKPGHFGAHHYLVHTYELMGRTDSALVHGEAYARAVPGVPHAQHMYAHDLMRVSRIPEAIGYFQTADSLERAYYAAEQVAPDLDWHRPHNLELLAVLQLHQGHVREAERQLREARALKPLGLYGFMHHRTLPEFFLLRGRAEEAERSASELVSHPAAGGRYLGHVLRGSARLARGNAGTAREDLAAAEREIASLEPMIVWYLSPQLDALRGAVALAEGRRAEADSLLLSSARAAAALPGPDGWVIALLRYQGLLAITREAGAWDLYERLARDLVQHAPTYAGGHYALGLALDRKGDRTAAASLRRAAELWRAAGADADLPEWVALQKRLGS